MKQPDPELQKLLDRLLALDEQYPYNALLINVPDKGDTEEFYSKLCELALDTEHECYWIKQALKGKTGLASSFLGFMYTAADKLRETKDIRWLRVGLGASILQDGYPDWRDYILALANLYVTAEEVGLDPVPTFSLIKYGEDSNFGHHPVVVERRRGY